MGRFPRIQHHELHYHVIVRCNNEAFHFKTDEDFSRYLQVLKKIKHKHRFHLFNYELMHSHVHLFIQPSQTVPLQKTMLLANWTYARDYNRRKKRKGHFWLDRYKAIPVASDGHALVLMRYINRNPLRAGMVEKPGDWKWSGYRFYALDEPNALLEAHPTYLGLSENPETRRKAFIDFVNMTVSGDEKRNQAFSNAKYIGSENFGGRLE